MCDYSAQVLAGPWWQGGCSPANADVLQTRLGDKIPCRLLGAAAGILSPTLESMSQVLQILLGKTFSGIVSISDMRYQKTTLLDADEMRLSMSPLPKLLETREALTIRDRKM